MEKTIAEGIDIKEECHYRSSPKVNQPNDKVRVVLDCDLWAWSRLKNQLRNSSEELLPPPDNFRDQVVLRFDQAVPWKELLRQISQKLLYRIHKSYASEGGTSPEDYEMAMLLMEMDLRAATFASLSEDQERAAKDAHRELYNCKRLLRRLIHQSVPQRLTYENVKAEGNKESSFVAHVDDILAAIRYVEENPE